MYSTHGEKIALNISAIKLGYVCIGILLFQLSIELGLMNSSLLAHYPVYYYLDLLVILPQLFALMMFIRYVQKDTEVRRQCLPISCTVLLVINFIFLLQSITLGIKNNVHSQGNSVNASMISDEKKDESNHSSNRVDQYSRFPSSSN